MHVEFQRWPHFLHGLFAGFFQYFLEKNEGPGWNSRNGGDIFKQGCISQQFNFAFPFIHECNFEFRRSHPVTPEWRVLHEYSTEVAKMGFVMQVADGVATANNEPFSGKEVGLRVMHVV